MAAASTDVWLKLDAFTDVSTMEAVVTAAGGGDGGCGGDGRGGDAKGGGGGRECEETRAFGSSSTSVGTSTAAATNARPTQHENLVLRVHFDLLLPSAVLGCRCADKSTTVWSAAGVELFGRHQKPSPPQRRAHRCRVDAGCGGLGV